ncbi:alpha/beta fold hydrolase [Oricola sp.]|uniref:alpha/beta fold hydrolase n=1 Tax=Oricola sp. TaxID=1979950 RepID=UPI0035170266
MVLGTQDIQNISRRGSLVGGPYLPVPASPATVPVTQIGPGHGEPDTVFLHGLFSSNSMWRAMSRLQDPLHAIALPLPGHFPWNTTPEETAALLGDFVFLEAWREAIRARTDRKVTLVAHSTGAFAALKMAALWPDLVERIVLFGAFSCGVTAAARSASASIVTLPLAGGMLFRMLYELWLYSPALYDRGLATAKAAGLGKSARLSPERAMHADLRRSNPESMRAVVRWLRATSIADDIAGISVPATVVIGTTDPVVGAREQIELARALPRGTAIICDVGHLPMFEAPELVRRLVVQPKWISRAG